MRHSSTTGCFTPLSCPPARGNEDERHFEASSSSSSPSSSSALPRVCELNIHQGRASHFYLFPAACPPPCANSNSNPHSHSHASVSPASPSSDQPGLRPPKVCSRKCAAYSRASQASLARQRRRSTNPSVQCFLSRRTLLAGSLVAGSLSLSW